ncbi:hypothetical protein CYMTET_17747 [Cymbomonas tetramitiformis]|uniref:Uncharacterized protein n=1 Tax=Cymbomonas tetramitiformis TaxID=36881 RepID=A0AAE0G9Y4_9CHLO|nr:hypothetical protein CYMTET_17747 [Cymbomonas tetramitiformis]
MNVARDEPSATTTTNAVLTRWSPELSWKLTAAVGASGAVLGPLCDGRHSTHDVLHYVSPTMISVPPLLTLETCWWVPVLFGVAGVLLGVSHPLLDDLRQAQSSEQAEAAPPVGGWDPSWAFVLAGIGLFVAQYDASGVLDQGTNVAASWMGQPGVLASTAFGDRSLDVFLAATAVLHWFTFDRSRQGLFMACLTAVGGPLIEIFLINQLGLYHYAHADFAGIPAWIPWVYFCGSPAVGNLGRRCRAELAASSALRSAPEQGPAAAASSTTRPRSGGGRRGISLLVVDPPHDEGESRDGEESATTGAETEKESRSLKRLSKQMRRLDQVATKLEAQADELEAQATTSASQDHGDPTEGKGSPASGRTREEILAAQQTVMEQLATWRAAQDAVFIADGSLFLLRLLRSRLRAIQEQEEDLMQEEVHRPDLENSVEVEELRHQQDAKYNVKLEEDLEKLRCKVARLEKLQEQLQQRGYL